jgi:uncharacterized cupredoxin-like copper-binding protein
MSNDTYSGGPSTDNFGIEQPPQEIPYEGKQSQSGERRYDGPAYGRPVQERYRPPSFVRVIGTLLIAFVVVMLLCGGITAVVAAMTFTSAPATATLDKTFSFSGTPTLVVHGGASSVHINPGGNGQVTLHVSNQVRAITHALAQSELDAIDVTTSQSGNVITIQQDDSRDLGWHFFNSRRIDLTITAPANTNLNIIEDAGSIDVTGFTGKVTTQVNAGSATLSNMTMATGSSLRVNAGSLDIDGALQSGASLVVVVDAGSADVTLPHNTSAHLNASASAGSVSVNGWDIPELHDAANVTAIGDLNPNPTGSITAHVNAGSFSLNAA